MKYRNINILGEAWRIEFRDRDSDVNLDDADGYTDSSVRLIVIDTMNKHEKGSKLDLDSYRAQVLRHEIMHAFLFESGLEHNTHSSSDWVADEEIIDWFSIQAPKIYDAFKEADCI